MSTSHTPPHLVDPVVLDSDGLVITLLTSTEAAAATRDSVRMLVAHLARTVLEFLQQRRSHAGLGRVLRPAVESDVERWRHATDWSGARLLGARGVLADDDRGVEGSFDLAFHDRRETFACRLEHDGRRWTCVRLAPVSTFLSHGSDL